MLPIPTVDRTPELELRLKAIRVGSEDTCCFWEKNRYSQVYMRRCAYCEYYKPSAFNENEGVCKFKGP